MNTTAELRNRNAINTISFTRQCLVCEALENPKAEIMRTDSAWLCPECKRKLRQMLYPKEGE